MKFIVKPLLFGLLLSLGGWDLSYSPAQAQPAHDQISVQAALPTPPPGPTPSRRGRGGASY